MPVIDLTQVLAVIEGDGSVRCINCIEGQDYWKGERPKEEILVTKDDIENPKTLYICDYCEREL